MKPAGSLETVLLHPRPDRSRILRNEDSAEEVEERQVLPMLPWLRFLIVVGVALLLTPKPVLAQDAPLQEAMRLIAMVEIQYAQKSYGAAVIVGHRAGSNSLILATANHMVRDASGQLADGVRVWFRDDALAGEERWVPAQVLGIHDRENDLAFLKVDEPPVDPASLPWNRRGKATALKFGDELTTVGYHGELWRINAAPDVFKDHQPPLFRFDSSTYERGASGGGVFNGRREIVGMGIQKAAMGKGGIALAIDTIFEVLDANLVSLDIVLGQHAKPPDPPIDAVDSRSSAEIPEGTTEVGKLVIGKKTISEISEGALAPIEFSLTAPANGRLTIIAHNLTQAGTPNSNLGPVVIYNHERVEYGRIAPKYLKAGSAERPSAPISASAGEVFFVEVNPKPGTSRIPFGVASKFVVVDIEDLYEPNQTKEAASSLASGQTIQSIVGYGTDSDDWYVVDSHEDGLLYVAAQNLNPSYTQAGSMAHVEIFDQGMVKRTTIAAKYLKPGGAERSTAPLTFEGGSSFFIHLTGVSPRHSIPYSLRTSFQPLDVEDVGEPNDDQSSAHALSEAASLTALVGPGSDSRDVYVVSPSTSGVLTISVQNLLPSSTIAGRLASAEIGTSTGQALGTIAAKYLQPGSGARSVKISATAGSSYYITISPAGPSNVVAYEVRTSIQ
jgi:hypothetical protein